MNFNVDALTLLIADLYGRSGVDDAIDTCREFMDPESVELLDEALHHADMIMTSQVTTQKTFENPLFVAPGDLGKVVYTWQTGGQVYVIEGDGTANSWGDPR